MPSETLNPKPGKKDKRSELVGRGNRGTEEENGGDVWWSGFTGGSAEEVRPTPAAEGSGRREKDGAAFLNSGRVRDFYRYPGLPILGKDQILTNTGNDSFQ